MAVLKETRSFRPFKSSEEYLYAMKEDLAEWLNTLYPELAINVDNFMDRLDTGVALCKHANSVRKSAEEYLVRRAARKMSTSTTLMTTSMSVALPITTHGRVHFLQAAKAGTFFARDNVSNFIDWCRRGLGVFECLLFETEDLIMRKNEKHVILCLLDVARRGAKYGMLAPLLVQLEREIDREIAADQRALRVAGEGGQGSEEEEEEDEMEQEEYNVQYGPMPQIVTNDLKSLDEMVRDLVERCRCPVQFPMIRVSEGKYRIGDTKVLIFVRILRNHVMVRVGGGWDTLSHYLDKHDPCRCKQQHRSPLTTKLILKNQGVMELNHAQVVYERSPPRTRRSSASSISSGGRPDPYLLNPSAISGARFETHTLNDPRSRSPTPRRNSTSRTYNNNHNNNHHNNSGDTLTVNSRATPNRNRSRSPTPMHTAARVRNNNSDTLTVDGRTTPSRNRSRSPTPRRSVPAAIRTRSRSPKPPGKTRKPSSTPRTDDPSCPESSEHTTAVRADNDSGSEVSDEGYRSLGIVVNQQALLDAGAVKETGDERTMVEKRGSVDSATSKRASFSSNFSNDESDEMLTTDSVAETVVATGDEVDCCSPMHVEEDCGDYLSSKKVGSISVQKRSLPENMKYGKENNPVIDSNNGRSAKTSLPADPRRVSPVTVNRGGSLSRMPRSRSIDNGDRRGSLEDTPTVGLAPRNSPVYRSNRSQPGGTQTSVGRISGKPSQNNTWSSRAKQRPALTPNTFTNTTAATPGKSTGFTRNSYQRSSLGSYGSSSHSTPTKKISVGRPQTGSVSLTTSPTKEISPLVRQILDVNDLGDDAKVLDKMKEIIQHYKDIVDERLVEEGKCDAGSKMLPQGPELDFTSTWVHNNGSLQGINHAAVARNELLEAAKLQATPRKDSKAESFSSKIPAPVGYRSSMLDVSRDS